MTETTGKPHYEDDEKTNRAVERIVVRAHKDPINSTATWTNFKGTLKVSLKPIRDGSINDRLFLFVSECCWTLPLLIVSIGKDYQTPATPPTKV